MDTVILSLVATPILAVAVALSDLIRGKRAGLRGRFPRPMPAKPDLLGPEPGTLR